jgi:hypothetical protein
MGKKLSLLYTLGFYVLLTYAGLLLFSINYLPVIQGLDPSWAYAVNRFTHGPEIFGKDIIFTYGPLGYLDVPQHVGNNLAIAAVVHILVWCILLYLLVQLWESGQRFGALLFTVALIFSNRLYFYYWDYFLSAIAILTFLLLLKRPKSDSLLVVLAVTIGLSFLVKFTGYILGMLLLTIYTAFRAPELRLLPRAKIWREVTLLAAAFASGPFAYLLYNPSFTGLFGYIRSSLDISSGYSSTMSLVVTPELAWKAAFAAAIIVACSVLCLFKKWVPPAGVLMTFAIAWVAFKHGYVRSEPGHAAMFFCFAILALAFLLGQVSLTPRRAIFFIVIFAVFSDFALLQAAFRWPVWSAFWWSPNYNLSQAGQLISWHQAERNLDELRADSYRTATVTAYTEKLNHSRVLFFPWDVAYGAQGSFTTVPLFVTQAYSGYTHFLDQKSADHITEESPPIDFVLFEWKLIDGRNPLLDVPATWNALFAGFVPESAQGDAILLRRRPSPLPIAFHEVSKATCPAENWFEVPKSNEPLALSLNLKPTIAGWLKTTLYQLEPVNLMVQTRSGLTVEIRFPPGVVSAPFPINYLPLNIPVLNTLWKDNLISDPIVKFLLTGPGLSSFNCGGMTFYQVSGTSIRVM